MKWVPLGLFWGIPTFPQPTFHWQAPQVHRAWGSAGLAPRLISAELLPGGFSMAVMERLSERGGWQPLDRLGAREKKLQWRSAVEAALRRAHSLEIPVGTSSDRGRTGVHGDMRPPK